MDPCVLSDVGKSSTAVFSAALVPKTPASDNRRAPINPPAADASTLWAAAPSGGAVTQQMHVSEPSQPPVFVPAESKLSEPYLK